MPAVGMAVRKAVAGIAVVAVGAAVVGVQPVAGVVAVVPHP